MPRLTLNLLGPACITIDGQLLDLRVRKELALLVYLAVEQQRHRRERVLALLWPDLPEEAARNNLRGVLAGAHRRRGREATRRAPFSTCCFRAAPICAEPTSVVWMCGRPIYAASRRSPSTSPAPT